jgi:predicted aconitase with swiveling domain
LRSFGSGRPRRQGVSLTRAARTYAAGEAEGIALVLAAPLSFWGGIDIETGNIIDHSHPDRGKNVTGRILVMPGGRGSSSASAVLAETIRRGTGPAAIVLSLPDPILTVGAIVAQSLYGFRCPIVVCPIEGLATGDRLRVDASGSVASVVQLS